MESHCFSPCSCLLISGCHLPQAFVGAEVYTNPTDFEAATATLGTPTIIDFEDLDASPLNDTYLGRDEFDGTFYSDQGIIFSNPNNYPLYIAPGGLGWNASNSLSVLRFPFDPAEPLIDDDDLIVTFNPPCVAVGLSFVDNNTSTADEFIQFIDTNGTVVAQVGFPPDFTSFRAFLGIVSLDRPIARINIVEGADDGDDVNYDDFICFPKSVETSVTVDIKPGSSPNSINPKSNGVIPVAILTTDTFDATTVDPLSVQFGPNGATEAHNKGHIEDVNQDGDLDLVLHFKTQETGIACRDTSASLTGKTVDGEPIEGSDSIKTVGCKK